MIKKLAKFILMLCLIWTGGYAMNQKIGSYRTGYISLPQSFQKFTDIGALPSEDIQYSDGITIFTLSTVKTDLNTKELAQNTIQYYGSLGVKNLKGIPVNFLQKYNGYQVYGYYNNGESIVNVYIFSINKDIKFLTFEGSKALVQENLNITDTYSVN